MKMIRSAALLLAALAMSCASATAQRVNTLPSAATLTGSERITAVQGAGCSTNVSPCAAVTIQPTQLATYLAGSFQPSDADLAAIAALATQPFGRSLLTQADAAAVRTVIGLGSIATQSAAGVTITGGSITGITDVAVTDGGTGASSAQTAAANLGATWAVCKSGTPVSTTGGTTEVTLASCTIPAGAIGLNGFIEIVPLFSWTSSANTKSVRIRLGGQEMWLASQTASLGIKAYLTINNTGSASTQRGSANPNGLGVLTVSVPTGTVNTAASTALTITCQPAAATDTCTLENYLVRITYGA